MPEAEPIPGVRDRRRSDGHKKGAPGSVTDMVEAARSGTGTKLPPGQLPAVSIDSTAARDPGYVPRYDLKAGIATAWPELSETAK